MEGTTQREPTEAELARAQHIQKLSLALDDYLAKACEGNIRDGLEVATGWIGIIVGALNVPHSDLQALLDRMIELGADMRQRTGHALPLPNWQRRGAAGAGPAPTPANGHAAGANGTNGHATPAVTPTPAKPLPDKLAEVTAVVEPATAPAPAADTKIAIEPQAEAKTEAKVTVETDAKPVETQTTTQTQVEEDPKPAAKKRPRRGLS